MSRTILIAFSLLLAAGLAAQDNTDAEVQYLLSFVESDSLGVLLPSKDGKTDENKHHHAEVDDSEEGLYPARSLSNREAILCRHN